MRGGLSGVVREQELFLSVAADVGPVVREKKNVCACGRGRSVQQEERDPVSAVLLGLIEQAIRCGIE